VARATAAMMGTCLTAISFLMSGIVPDRLPGR
jgi:hypothetical protein